MNTLTGRYVRAVEHPIFGVDWATAHASRIELTVGCKRDVSFFTVQRDTGFGFQDSVLHEELYPDAIRLHDYSAPAGADVIYRATFFGEDHQQIGVPVVISVPTHWIEPPW